MRRCPLDVGNKGFAFTGLRWETAEHPLWRGIDRRFARREPESNKAVRPVTKSLFKIRMIMTGATARSTFTRPPAKTVRHTKRAQHAREDRKARPASDHLPVRRPHGHPLATHGNKRSEGGPLGPTAVKHLKNRIIVESALCGLMSVIPSWLPGYSYAFCYTPDIDRNHDIPYQPEH